MSERQKSPSANHDKKQMSKEKTSLDGNGTISWEQVPHVSP